MADRPIKTRRTFILWTAGLAALASLRPWSLFKKPGKKASPTVMLTQDGTLVEVDPRHISVNGKATDRELQEWIRR